MNQVILRFPTEKIFMTVAVLALATSYAISGEGNLPRTVQAQAQSDRLRQMFDQYYEEYLVLFPHMATLVGDHRYDDRLANDLSDEHRGKVAALADKYSRELAGIDRASLTTGDQLSCEVLQSDLRRLTDGLKFPEHWIPVGSMFDWPTMFALLASGMSIQPFKTVADYEKFLGRVRDFTVWTDTAIANMRKGAAAEVVQPRVIMEKSVTQMESLLVSDLRQSVFYQPILQMPADFTHADKERLTQAYTDAIEKQIIPAYRKMASFIRQEYLPKCRDSFGFSALPNGRAWYEQRVRLETTTDLTPEQIFDLGTGEVRRITGEMESLKAQTAFTGDLVAFGKHLEQTATTYRTKDDLIQAYRQLRATVEPNLPRLFGHLPKAGFEIRPVEQFREKTSQSQLIPGTPDGSRRSVFYVNADGIEQQAMTVSESLFVHEALPGHHFQIALAFEQSELPKFRRFALGYSAYMEGWALYAESLGSDLGCYRDVKQRLGHFGEEVFRARRLLVDVGLHAKGWTRDRAIECLLEIPGFREADAVLEVDRYIGWPGQALSYKCGQLKISAIRSQAEKALGTKFDLRAFHDELLKDGSLPLDVLEAKMDRWIAAQER